MAVVTLFGCQNSTLQRQLAESNDSLRAVIAERDAALDEVIGTMNMVEQGFRSISEAQGRINLNAIGGEYNRKEALQNDIAFISETLAKNKAEIDRLQAQLSKNGAASKQLKAMLASLQAQLAEKTKDIETLHAELAKKNIHIGELDDVIAELSKSEAQNKLTIEKQQARLHSVWYAIGTKRELKEQKILKSGDVLTEADANLDYFRKENMYELTDINTYAKHAKLLTSHPDGSYTLKRNKDKMYVLSITDPVKFWSRSKYLVIQVR